MLDLALRLVPAINDFGAVVRWPARPLLGRSAVVTHSTAGLGLAIARALAAEGANVMLNARAGGAEAERLRESMAAGHQVGVRFCAADPATPGGAAALIAQAREEFGSLEILVNCAGVRHCAPVEALPPGQWDAVLADNLGSSFHTVRAALPGMRAGSWGRIVNVASSHALAGRAGDAAYAAAHHGLLGLTKAVALECARSAITCNAVCAGWPAGPDPQAADGSAAPEQVGAAVVFLCSSAAAEIRGATLCMDGGLAARREAPPCNPTTT